MELIDSLVELRDVLVRIRFVWQGENQQALRASANRMVHQLDDYLLPRLQDFDAPLLVVVGGSTGAGKSTLVNSLLGQVVSTPGVIRPTTKAPVLVYYPKDEAWFDSSRILPGLIRTRIASADRRSLVLSPNPVMPSGIAILDAPDIDSVDVQNRALAAQLLAAGDLWLFVTSAARYADAVPWEYLLSAAGRGAAVAVVVDRIPAEAMPVVPADLGRLMSERGLGDAPLFAVPEVGLDEDGLLPAQAFAPIRQYLAELAQNQQAKQDLIKRTLQGALAELLAQLPQLHAGLSQQLTTRQQLADDAISAFQICADRIELASQDGSLLRGEVLTRWHDYVGATDISRAIDSKIGWLRDRIVGFFGVNNALGREAEVAAGAGLESLIMAEANRACERVTQAWQANPAGRQLLNKDQNLIYLSEQFAEQTPRLIRDWQSDVLRLVSEQGASKRKSARIAALGVNGVGAALMLVIFFNTGGLSGAEGGVAVATAVVAQRLLEAIFGDEAVRRLANQAKQNLTERVENLLAVELSRYLQKLAELDIDAELPAEFAERANRAADLVARNFDLALPAELVAPENAHLALPASLSGVDPVILPANQPGQVSQP